MRSLLNSVSYLAFPPDPPKDPPEPDDPEIDNADKDDDKWRDVQESRVAVLETKLTEALATLTELKKPSAEPEALAELRATVAELKQDLEAAKAELTKPPKTRQKPPAPKLPAKSAADPPVQEKGKARQHRTFSQRF